MKLLYFQEYRMSADATQDSCRDQPLSLLEEMYFAVLVAEPMRAALHPSKVLSGPLGEGKAQPSIWYLPHWSLRPQHKAKSVFPERGTASCSTQTFLRYVISIWPFIKTVSAFLQVDNEWPEILGFGLMALLLLSYLYLYCMLSLQVAQGPYKWHCSDNFCSLLINQVMLDLSLDVGNRYGKAQVSVNGECMGLFIRIWQHQQEDVVRKPCPQTLL